MTLTEMNKAASCCEEVLSVESLSFPVHEDNASFYPHILMFCCNWCSYAGADLAGVSRFQYPASVRIIRVMCSGRVDLSFILEGFRRGADGVLITGCHIGDCHYLTGNEYARDRMVRVKPLLETLGVDPQRFRLEWISASEGKKFSEVVTTFTETIKGLGPLNLNIKT
ncbi:MAG TPA: hydrogenase iron-sulfur subunit [Candidatus Lokiarchaeia archaeon]|nr:hydrogenase iron-sulfur subunit [Candidatus Lokiarchaeia archaeon]